MPDIAVLGIDVDSRSVTPAATALDKLTASATKTAPAIDAVGKVSKTAAPAIDQVAQASTKAATAGEGLGRGAAAVGSAFQRFGPQIQNTSYQVADFAVQVGSGTSALRAFSQQAPQILGAFGPTGALAGAIVGIGGALLSGLIPALTGSGAAAGDALSQFMAYTDGLDKAAKKADDLSKALRGLSDERLKQSIAESEAARRRAAEAPLFSPDAIEGGALIGGRIQGGPSNRVDPEQVRLEAAQKEELARRARADRRLNAAPGDEGRPDAASRREEARLRIARANTGLDPNAAIRKSQSLYPDGAGNADAMTAELNARNKADFDKQAAADKAAASKRASEAKAAADHAKAIAESLKDMTVAANDNAAALNKQQEALKGTAANSIALENAQKQARLTRDQTQIETQLRRFRGDASAEQIQQARAALQAQAEASRSLEDQTKLLQDQVQWEKQLGDAKRNRQQADQDKLRELQGQTASMMLDEQRAKVEENREVFKQYGQVAFDALGQIALGGEKANVALSNLLKSWANLAFQMASQKILQALAVSLFPQTAGTAASFGATAFSAAAAGAGAGAGVGPTGPGGLAGHAASGADVDQGRSYVVGEHGRERFTPWQKGKVEPESRRGANTNFNIAPTYNISLSGSATPEDAERVSKQIDKKFNDTIDARLAKHARAGGAFAA